MDFYLHGSRMFFLALVFLMVNANCIASEEGQVDVRRFDDSKIEEISNSDDFFYLEKKESNSGAVYALSDWIKRMLRLVFGNWIARTIFSNLHLIILFIAVVLIVLKISHLSPAKIFYKAKKIEPKNFSIDEQSIDAVDFADLINSALKKKNYRLALRYHYLELLKILSEKEFIDWNPHKTNYEIVNELRGKPFGDNFRSLANVFEYVWYGEFKINESGFQEVRNDFVKIKKQII